MIDNDDEQSTGMDGEIDTTAAVPLSPRTVAAERFRIGKGAGQSRLLVG
jgi:hypothetical protein